MKFVRFAFCLTSILNFTSISRALLARRFEITPFAVSTCQERPSILESDWIFLRERPQDSRTERAKRTTAGENMARYGKAAGKSVKSAVHRMKSGTLKSGKSGHGGRVKSRKQAIAIGLSEARKKGAKVPARKAS